ncbi:MAG: hypothetical protein HS130_09295 [Deltaproteobacteria bacterium]|nr:hypothetical protein [Deltaproteobacteria bacterium]MCL4874522.1 hypothetical protein [bacterium]
MSELNFLFLNVGHGDCSFIIFPNDARLMIDCGGNDCWPSLLLTHLGFTKKRNPIPGNRYALDKLIISHPHGDHITDLKNIYEKIGFRTLLGGCSEFIDRLSADQVDFKKRGRDSAEFFFSLSKEKYIYTYNKTLDRLTQGDEFIVKSTRFIQYENGMDLNELSYFVSLEYGGHKILFTGDITSAGINKILKSPNAQKFEKFVRGTTILKIPHHGRENGCSLELFRSIGRKPLIGLVSDEVLNDRNEGTSSIGWYSDKIQDQAVEINGSFENRKVLTTRSDKNILIKIKSDGKLQIFTNVFSELERQRSKM